MPLKKLIYGPSVGYAACSWFFPLYFIFSPAGGLSGWLLITIEFERKLESIWVPDRERSTEQGEGHRVGWANPEEPTEMNQINTNRGFNIFRGLVSLYGPNLITTKTNRSDNNHDRVRDTSWIDRNWLPPGTQMFVFIKKKGNLKILHDGLDGLKFDAGDGMLKMMDSMVR